MRITEEYRKQCEIDGKCPCCGEVGSHDQACWRGDGEFKNWRMEDHHKRHVKECVSEDNRTVDQIPLEELMARGRHTCKLIAAIGLSGN